MKQNFKKILCTALASTMLMSGATAVMAEGEETPSVSPVINLDIANYTGFMNGGVLKDTVSGKSMQTTNGTNTTMTGINYGIYKEETDGTPYLYVDGMAKVTGLGLTNLDQMSVEMWIAVDKNIPQNVSNIYRLLNSDKKVVERCFTKTASKNGVAYRSLKFGGVSDNQGNDWYNYDANTGWNHVVVTQFKDANDIINTHVYVNGKYAGRSQIAKNSYNNNNDIALDNIDSLILGGQVNRTYNTVTQDANNLGGNAKFYLGEFKVYNTCLDGASTDNTNITPLYNEDKDKFNFTPSKANVADDGAVIDLDMSGSGVSNKVNQNDIITPVAGEEFTKGYINNPGKSVPYITVNAENKGYKIDSARFERLPEQTYEMWLRFKEAAKYNTMLSVGNDNFSKQQSFRLNDGSYNQAKSGYNGNCSGLLYGDSYSWFEDGENNDEWIHVVVSRYMTMENDTLMANISSAKYYSMLYINGKPLGETVSTNSNAGADYTQSVINNLQNISLGSKNGGDVGQMDIAKFKVYDRFMTTSEVQNIYNSEKSTFINNYSNDFEILKVEPLDQNFAKSIYVRESGTKNIDAFADSRGGMLNITFSTPVNPESVTEDSIAILKDGQEIKGGVSILGLSEQGYCVNVAYGALDIEEKDTYTLKVKGLQNLNGVALYAEKDFYIQNNAVVFGADDITQSATLVEYLKSGYTIEDAILDVKPFEGKTIEVTTNYDVAEFDASAVSISDMTIASATYENRTITITTNEDFTVGKEYTVIVDGKEKVFNAQALPAAVTVYDVLYTDDTGYIIEDVSEMVNTTEVNAVVNVVVRDDTDVSGADFSVLLAVYDESGTLVAVDKKDSNMDSGSGVQQFYANVDGLNDKATYRVEAKLLYNGADYMSNNVKTFVWSVNDGSLRPLSEVK